MKPQDWATVKEMEVRGRARYEHLLADEVGDKCSRCNSVDLIVVGAAQSGKRIAICRDCGENLVLPPVRN